jgi:hypothetical protein
MNYLKILKLCENVLRKFVPELNCSVVSTENDADEFRFVVKDNITGFVANGRIPLSIEKAGEKISLADCSQEEIQAVIHEGIIRVMNWSGLDNVRGSKEFQESVAAGYRYIIGEGEDWKGIYTPKIHKDNVKEGDNDITDELMIIYGPNGSVYENAKWRATKYNDDI